jgi:SulP family sulfate permease
LQVVLGFVRFGWLLNLIRSPVLMGFTQAAALLIIASQLPAVLGVETGWQQWLAAPHLHAASTAFGLISLALLVLARRWRPAFPSVLFIVAGMTAISAWAGFEASGGKVVGALPAGLPSLYLPGLPGLPDWRTLGQLLLPTLVITLVSFLETASSAKVENQGEGQIWNQNQDLIGQGLAKIASGLSGAFPTSSSFSRSALNIHAGARTGWATMVSVAVVVIALLLFTPALRYVPQAVLAAIALVAVVGLLKPWRFAHLWRVSRVEATIAGVTFLITLATAPRLYWGVLAGVLMGLTHFLHHRLHPRIVEVGLHPDGSLRDRNLWKLPPLALGLYALRMDADLDFAAASDFERAITEHLAACPDARQLCLFAQPINRIDATGVKTFGQIRRQLGARGITLPVEAVLRRAGELTDSPLLKLYRTDADALAALGQPVAVPADLAAAAF